MNLSNYADVQLNNKSKIQCFIVRSTVNTETCETVDGITMIYEIKNINQVFSYISLNKISWKWNSKHIKIKLQFDLFIFTFYYLKKKLVYDSWSDYEISV